MAVAYLGAAQVDAGGGNGSDSTVTIPSGATLAMISSTHWDDASNYLTNVVIDGQSDTNIAFSDKGASDEVGYYLARATGFSTGASKTVSWTWLSDEAITEGGRIYITFWSGADYSTSGIDRVVTGDAQVASLSTPTGSYVLTQVETYSATCVMQPDGSPTVNSVYDDDLYQSQYSDVDYFARTQATHTIDMNSESYAAIIAVVLTEAAAGGATPRSNLALLGVS